MSNPLGAILAGLAGGASTLGSSIDARQKLEDAAKQREFENRIQLAKLADIDEARTQRQWERDQAAQQAMRALSEKSLSDLTGRYERAGVKIIDPNVMQAITGSRLMPSMSGADFGPAQLAQSATNAATQGGQAIGAGVQNEAIKALAQSTANKGAMAPLSVNGRNIGYAQDLPTQQHEFDMEKANAGKAITPYQQATLDIARQRLSLQKQKGAGTLNKDLADKQFAYRNIEPSINQLETWYNEDRNPGVIASTAGRLPVVGNVIVGMSDPEFQQAKTAAHNAAVEFLEVQPKSRFQPSTVEEVQKLIEPQMGDTPGTRALKKARILRFKKALQQRAQLGPWAQTPEGSAGADPFADIIGGGSNP